MDINEMYMREALHQAEAAAEIGEVPVGAVVVRDGEIIAKAYNHVETDRNSSGHAEMLAIREAERVLGSKWLTGCELYVTLEPCAMCAGAMVLARLDRLWIGAMDPKNGACGSVFNVVQEERLNHRMEVETGILEAECGQILSDFFRNMRAVKARKRKLFRQRMYRRIILMEETINEEKRPDCTAGSGAGNNEHGIRFGG